MWRAVIAKLSNLCKYIIMTQSSVGTTAVERITAQLNTDAQRRADATAESHARLIERQEHQNKPEAILGAAVLNLYSDIDHHNRQKRSWKNIGNLATKVLTRGRVVRKTHIETGYVDIQGKFRRLYLLKGNIDARSISLPSDSTTITTDATFNHNLILRLSRSLPEVAEGARGELGCSIFEVTTESRSGLREEELKYTIKAFRGELGASSVINSFTDGVQDDLLITSNNSSLEHALAIMRQAREALPL